MKTKKELEAEITKLTSTINSEYPELTKYIAEIAVIESDDKGVNLKNLENYHQSLKDILSKYAKTHDNSTDPSNTKLPGYPEYPEKEDIYFQGKEEKDINPENLAKYKAPNEKVGVRNEKGFEDDMSGDDLDVPGSELDNQQEKIGSEDEENNYYSIGGDKHNDLEETKA